MANRDMKVSVLVQLVDRLTAPLRGMTRGIAGVANRVADLGRRIGVVGAALAAVSFMGPIKQAAAWDAQLRDIAITAGKTGGAAEAMIADLSARYQKLAFDTGQTSMEIAAGAKTLIASGMDSTLIDKILPTIAKVATATGATLEDTAKTAFALSDTLKVPADQLEAMLGKLTMAGKLGRFEFRDMAREFPELTAQMAKFGIVGREAVEFLGSGLQVAMLGTASPAQAATNLNNFLTKINAPEAIKKFEKELKVDVTGVMTDATAKGINPIEAVIQKMIDKLKPHQAEIDKIMKKAGVSDKQRAQQIETLLAGTRVGKLYQDMQVLGFILPMMQSIDKFKDFRRQLREAGVETIVEDFATRMKGLEPQLRQFGVLTGGVANRIGLAFASHLPGAMRALQQLLHWVDQIDKKWPGLINGVLTWTGALLVLGAGIAILTPVISALAATLAIIFSPITLVVAGFALLGHAAWSLYQSWDTIGPKLKAIWDGMTNAVVSAQNAIKQWLDGLKQELDGFGSMIDQKLTAIVEPIRAFVGRAGAALLELGPLLQQAGVAAIQGLWDGMTTKFGELIGWVQGIPGRIAAAIGNIDLSNIIKWPTLPKWLGGTAPAGPGEPGLGTMDGFNPTSAPGGLGGQSGFTRTAGGPAANSNVQVGGRIVVEAAEGTRIVNVQSDNPAVPVTPNRGTMLGRA